MTKYIKYIPMIMVFLFTLIFIFMQSPPTPKGYVIPSLKEDTPSDIVTVKSNGESVLVDYSCTDVGKSYFGYPFRMNGYDYCKEEGFILIPSALNLLIYILISVLIYRLSKRLLVDKN